MGREDTGMPSAFDLPTVVQGIKVASILAGQHGPKLGRSLEMKLIVLTFHA
jgi:hypothetical protein